MKISRLAATAVLALALSSGLATADPVLEQPSGWSITYYYTNSWEGVATGEYHSPCDGMPFFIGNPGPYEETIHGSC